MCTGHWTTTQVRAQWGTLWRCKESKVKKSGSQCHTCSRSKHDAFVHWPKSSKHSQQRGLSHATGSHHKQTLARVHKKGGVFEQQCTAGAVASDTCHAHTGADLPRMCGLRPLQLRGHLPDLGGVVMMARMTITRIVSGIENLQELDDRPEGPSNQFSSAAWCYLK
jgi:hypothetical protein